MKIILTNDWHMLLDNPKCRLDSAYAALQKKIRWIIERAIELDAPIIVAGDVTDKSRSWRLLAAWTPVLEAYRGEVNVFVVYGQHDTKFYDATSRDATILGNFAQNGLVHVLGDAPTILPGVCLYGLSYGDEPRWTAAEMKRMREDNNYHILAVHDMIIPKLLWTGQEGATYAPEYINKLNCFDVIICGDCHRKFKYKAVDGDRYIVNAGCLIRKTADVYNFNYLPGIWVYETGGGMHWEEVPHAPALEVISRDHIDEKAERDERISAFIGAVKSGSLHLGTDFIPNLVTFCKQNKIKSDVTAMIREVIGNDEL